jgi:hypothetical protein
MILSSSRVLVLAGFRLYCDFPVIFGDIARDDEYTVEKNESTSRFTLTLNKLEIAATYVYTLLPPENQRKLLDDLDRSINGNEQHFSRGDSERRNHHQRVSRGPRIINITDLRAFNNINPTQSTPASLLTHIGKTEKENTIVVSIALMITCIYQADY